MWGLCLTIGFDQEACPTRGPHLFSYFAICDVPEGTLLRVTGAAASVSPRDRHPARHRRPRFPPWGAAISTSAHGLSRSCGCPARIRRSERGITDRARTTCQESWSHTAAETPTNSVASPHTAEPPSVPDPPLVVRARCLQPMLTMTHDEYVSNRDADACRSLLNAVVRYGFSLTALARQSVDSSLCQS
jgi:hypothetical protein